MTNWCLCPLSDATCQCGITSSSPLSGPRDLTGQVRVHCCDCLTDRVIAKDEKVGARCDHCGGPALPGFAPSTGPCPKHLTGLHVVGDPTRGEIVVPREDVA